MDPPLQYLSFSNLLAKGCWQCGSNPDITYVHSDAPAKLRRKVIKTVSTLSKVQLCDVVCYFVDSDIEFFVVGKFPVEVICVPFDLN